MAAAPMTIENSFWDKYQFNDEDLEFINNHLFELETPQTTNGLLRAVVENRIALEKKALTKKHNNLGKTYLPKNSFQVKDNIVFPALQWTTGTVESIRDGNNPEYGEFKVLDVRMADGNTRYFVSQFENHQLNDPQAVLDEGDSPQLDAILSSYGQSLEAQLEEALNTDPDLALITGSWFPRALFVDINPGQLNLAEAVLDMAGGGPMPTPDLMDQIDLPKEVNTRLTEFSLNLALQEDTRFDEVGPAGDVMWYLERLEPEDVRVAPIFLQYQPVEVDRSVFTPQMLTLEETLDDELCTVCREYVNLEKTEITLTYPHWRAGTLPLTGRTNKLFPTAFESPRIQFNFIDGDTKNKFQGWVVRPNHYVVGLREWYEANGVVPGSLITIFKANADGDVVIKIEKRRTKEWFRTVLVGADGGIVFALLKQQVSTTYDERMATVVPDTTAVDRLWKNAAGKRINYEQTLLKCAQELTKLNPQGHFHAQELYAAVNVVRRCPPEVVFYWLVSSDSFGHVGDLYYRIVENGNQE